MNAVNTEEFLNDLVDELCKLTSETECVEFKESNSDPTDIGKYISALSNSAALAGKAYGYLVWGVRDKTHVVVGTKFKPSQTKHGNESLDTWLLQSLDPKPHFQFHEISHNGKPVVVLEIPRASGSPVSFRNIRYIRVKSRCQKLNDHRQLEAQLWRVFQTTPFEELIAVEGMDVDALLKLFDYPRYFELLDQPLPADHKSIIERLRGDRMIVSSRGDRWGITNLGAILFAKNLDAFRGLERKAVRVIVYDGKGRMKTVREQKGNKGYASGFEGLIEFINAILPRNEVIGQAIRKEVLMYPEIAIRELIANAVIHQDFHATGSGPMVEIFSDRMEITNPGSPLICTDRFLDHPPQSRNEKLASFMRRIGICEERGSGVDKVVFQTEVFQLPAPLFEMTDGATRVTLFAHKELRDMDRADRLRACYLHACLRYVQNDHMTNSSLRKRFGISEKNSAIASRFIREATEEKLIKPFDQNQGKKYAKYLPFWA